MKMIKKILSLMMVLSFIFASLISFSACAPAYSEEEAREILAEVLAKDVELNRIIWGEGLPTEKEPEEHVDDSTFYYMEVSMLSKYTSLDELKEAVKETYTDELLDIVWQSAFGYEDIESEIIPRYAQNKNGFLQVNVAKSTLRTFDLTSVAYIGESKLVRAKKDMIKIEIQTSSDGENFIERTLELYLVDGVWKLDTQTWCIDFQY
ncbi:MAG: hypothetical protein E7633_07365 [Ruminococcaceae bacterium]|nr:hypothetical protein [Oscillospiraceae bacterium]